MKAVGKHHSTGNNSKIKIPRPYPAPCTISSVPYVPPDTMKNVAATSGQSVSFAILFFAVEIAGEEIRAGRDEELNFYSCPPKRFSLSRWLKRVRIRRIQVSLWRATRKCTRPHDFSSHDLA